MSAPTFAELADYHGTDKGSGKHYYCDFYDMLFAPIRESATKILEIGVYRWKSLLALESYFKNAKIVGLDCVPYTPNVRGRISVYQGRQERRDHLLNLIKAHGADYDLIIDDGGHRMHQQQVSLGCLFRFLKPGGLYIIEDLHTSLIPRYHDHQTNTTLDACQEFLIKQTIASNSIPPKELAYLNNQLSYLSIMRVNTKAPGMVAVLKKRN